MNYSEMWFARIPHKLANNLECTRDMRSCHCVVVKMLTSIRWIVGLGNEQLSICVNFNTKLKKSVPCFGISERADESGSSADLLHTCGPYILVSIWVPFSLQIFYLKGLHKMTFEFFNAQNINSIDTHICIINI